MKTMTETKLTCAGCQNGDVSVMDDRGDKSVVLCRNCHRISVRVGEKSRVLPLSFTAVLFDGLLHPPMTDDLKRKLAELPTPDVRTVLAVAECCIVLGVGPVDSADVVTVELPTLGDRSVEVSSLRWHREMLDGARPTILRMLRGLPKEFRNESGGGLSMTRIDRREDGSEWDENGLPCCLLLAMALATGYAKISTPRELWDAMPGGLPYIELHLPAEDA